MSGVAVVASGNYDLEIDTGFLVDAFVLDDATKGVLITPSICLTVLASLRVCLTA
jgi:hypothetical protein